MLIDFLRFGGGDMILISQHPNREFLVLKDFLVQGFRKSLPTLLIWTTPGVRKLVWVHF